MNNNNLHDTPHCETAGRNEHTHTASNSDHKHGEQKTYVKWDVALTPKPAKGGCDVEVLNGRVEQTLER